MKYKIEDNHLMIYENNNELVEDATENQNECEYCEHNPETCNADSPTSEVRQYGGQFCDKMKCKYSESTEE